MLNYEKDCQPQNSRKNTKKNTVARRGRKDREEYYYLTMKEVKLMNYGRREKLEARVRILKRGYKNIYIETFKNRMKNKIVLTVQSRIM